MPSFFMAITITSVNPPPVKAPIAWDWQAAQHLNPYNDQALVTFSADLTTGTVEAAVPYHNPPAYTVTGVRGLLFAGGAAANGDLTKSDHTPPAATGGTSGTGTTP